MANTNTGHLFDGEIAPETIWKLYEAGESYNDKLKLYDTVRDNENMFIGKQWEGVTANGLPTPVLNFIKRTVMFKVATISSDNLKVNASPLGPSARNDELFEPARIVTEECDALMERNNVVRLSREFCRNAAVDGDGCLYTYWDTDVTATGKLGEETIDGQIATEVLQNTRVLFGDQNDRRVQKQPYIIIKKYYPVRTVKRMAEKAGAKDYDSITADEDDKSMDTVKRTDDKVTVLLFLWRDPDSGEIWSYECTRSLVLSEPKSLLIRLYPLVWLNWDFVQDCYHGQAEVSGLVPNQVATNKLWAAHILANMNLGFPKVMYDRTRIKSWTNQVGVAIPCNGGDMDNVAKILTPGAPSPQAFQLMQALIEQTERCMGVTQAALGDTRPDNTSAIIALQKASATPMELTKQQFYGCIEDLFRIYVEFMAFYYGKRSIVTKTPDKVTEAIEFAAENHPDIEATGTVTTDFDYSTLKDIRWALKLDVGASSYFSEIATISTIAEWVKQGLMLPSEGMERLPTDFMPKQQELIAAMKEREGAQAAPEPTAQPGNQAIGELEGGGGYGALQRAINNTGEVPEA